MRTQKSFASHTEISYHKFPDLTIHYLALIPSQK